MQLPSPPVSQFESQPAYSSFKLPKLRQYHSPLRVVEEQEPIINTNRIRNRVQSDASKVNSSLESGFIKKKSIMLYEKNYCRLPSVIDNNNNVQAANTLTGCDTFPTIPSKNKIDSNNISVNPSNLGPLSDFSDNQHLNSGL